MMDQKDLKARQSAMQANIEAVKQSLLQLPNVVAVGIGIKESNNEFTEEISYRVFVEEKKPLTDLRPEEVVPPVINGIKTDVLKPYIVSLRPGVCGTDRKTTSTHRPLQAGIAISNDSISYGTLGWFGKLADNSTVLLTNKHVIGDVADDKVAQPMLGEVSKCCCCECGSDNVVGKVVFGLKNAVVDCAIAKIDSGFVAGLKFEIANNASTEVLTVADPPTAAAVVGANVRKIGARSGFTRGVIVHIGDTAVEGTDPGGGTITIKPDQVLVIPDTAETYQVKDVSTDPAVCKFAFSNNGDSGSVIINDDDRIVALLYGGDEKTNSVDITFANNIANVLAALTTATHTVTLSSSEGGRKDYVRIVRPAAQEKTLNLLERMSRENQNSFLYKLYEKHHCEVLDLINQSRPAGVAWQRNQGPAFVAALARAAREETYRIPFRINEVSREQLLEKLAAVFMLHGSEALKKDITRFKDDLIGIMNKGETIEQFAEALKEAGLIDTLPFMNMAKPI